MTRSREIGAIICVTFFVAITLIIIIPSVVNDSYPMIDLHLIENTRGPYMHNERVTYQVAYTNNTKTPVIQCSVICALYKANNTLYYVNGETIDWTYTSAACATNDIYVKCDAFYSYVWLSSNKGSITLRVDIIDLKAKIVYNYTYDNNTGILEVYDRNVTINFDDIVTDYTGELNVKVTQVISTVNQTFDTKPNYDLASLFNVLKFNYKYSNTSNSTISKKRSLGDFELDLGKTKASIPIPSTAGKVDIETSCSFTCYPEISIDIDNGDINSLKINYTCHMFGYLNANIQSPVSLDIDFQYVLGESKTKAKLIEHPIFQLISEVDFQLFIPIKLSFTSAVQSISFNSSLEATFNFGLSLNPSITPIAIMKNSTFIGKVNNDSLSKTIY